MKEIQAISDALCWSSPHCVGLKIVLNTEILTIKDRRGIPRHATTHIHVLQLLERNFYLMCDTCNYDKSQIFKFSESLENEMTNKDRRSSKKDLPTGKATSA